MDKYCARCGCKLDKTSWGRYFCMNCGILEANQDNESDNKSDETPSYVN
jgi:uncharacterized Zn finger protein (UPF0148 family)